MADEESASDTTRLLALSDGVFAIASTALVLNVDLPTEPSVTVVTWGTALGE